VSAFEVVGLPSRVRRFTSRAARGEKRVTESTIDVAGTDQGDVRAPRREPVEHRGWRHFVKSVVRAAAWALCIALMYELLVAVHYPLRDADSNLYEMIAASLERRPWVEWLAPMWPPGKPKSGLFVEHLPFFFWPTAALGRMGFARAALLANLLYFLAGLYLLFLIARRLVRAEGAWLAVALYAISPLGIQYLARANHENAWAVGFLGALYCMRDPLRRARSIGFVAFAAFAFLIKGVLALALFPVLGLWWWWSSRRRGDLLWFAAALAAIGLLSLGYEWAYRRLTGESFFANYVLAQMTYVHRDEGIGLVRKLINPVYYAANILWFALPSSLLAIYAAYRTRRSKRPPTDAQALAYLGCGSQVALALPISRRAARYIFPAYALIHLPAAQFICDQAPALGDWLLRNEEYLPYALMLLLMLVLVARVAVDLHLYHFVQVF